MIINYLDRPIAYHRAFVKIGTGITGAVMLSQAVYWSSRTADRDGWFYKTQTEWEDETGMTRYEQEGARKKLKALGVLEEVKKGVPCKVFYRVNTNRIEALLIQYAEIPQTSLGKTNSTVCGNSTNSDVEIPQTNTETTQRLPETTTDIGPKSSAKPSKPKKSASRKRVKLPEDFKPSAQHEKLSQDLGVDLPYELEQFKDYHAAKGSLMADWQAALRTWIRNSAKFNKGKKPKQAGYITGDKLDYSKGVNEDGTF